ncbi:MAG: hypothetical protein HOB84_09935 [Candidatus Marinimicrobia bacterium]|mgnify:CR=1 FL=1|jgi:hypothetical protein|nr:hypothetical protein [Candidatus Neomarinimicrobiota bacterium]MBT4360823.1 hypothetical protein [Candidatus Neomarinimicrobiota bacterium]MBT4715081.1 hypothetical protein [Candidatus Neomarinimicrobiota bacterium]MBT4945790.1 hypothetical protein [Candidatus Neomarinimicrobiota bacterium]MBT5271091.1 hypothetical protein [Candidatus Neomarinimicrobiota bacterium]
MEFSLLEYRRIALMSLWIGLIVTVGMVFALIPNVELIILSAFLGGVALGPRRGFIVALVGEAIFSALNPIGSGLGFPILYVFQITSVGFSGLIGGILSRFLTLQNNYMIITITLGLVGFLLTLIYDALTALSFPISSGMTEGTIWATLSTGLIFFVLHLVSNTALFGLFGPGLVQLVHRQLEMHGLMRGQHAS